MNEPTCFTNNRRQVAVQLADEYLHARADLDKFKARLAGTDPAAALLEGDEGFDAAARCSVIDALLRELWGAKTPQDLAQYAAWRLRVVQAQTDDPADPNLLATDVRRRLGLAWARYVPQLAAVSAPAWERE